VQRQNLAALNVRLQFGRHPRYTIRYLAVLSAAAVLAACSGESVTGPSPASNPTAAGNKGHGPNGSPASDTTAPPAPSVSASNPIANASFWIDPYSNAKKQADAWRSTRPADAAQMDKIATHSEAQWFGSWNSDIYSAVNSAVTAVTKTGALPVLVAYNMLRLDCGTGGAQTADAYKTWMSAFASGLAGRKAVVVLEPDAIAAIGCLSSADQATRFDLISYAVQVLKAQGQTIVYLDGGHPGWQTTATMATRLTNANIAAADGFFLNVSNFLFTSDNITYGSAISAAIGGKHFIVDTSRNGVGPTADSQWCNPDGRALGTAATTKTGNALVDAFLWIKRPGESDGACNGGPNGGAWWADYALGLAQRSTI
jgi:endoglucanase